MIDSLLDRTFRRESRRAMRLGPSGGIPAPPPTPVFVYVHVPFCEVLCPYCSFHRVRHRPDKARRYFAALRRELRGYHERGFRFSGVYVGGGTPTVDPGELAETLALAYELGASRDISVETNPADLRDEVLDALFDAGVRRLSVGVQSFDDGLLREMDRYEKYGSAAEIRDRLAAAADRFDTLNVDMIYNLPHQTEAILEADLEAVRSGPANQVSFYPLMTSGQTERKMAATMGLPHRGRMHRYYRRILEGLRPAFAPSSAWCFSRGARLIDEYIVEAPDYVGIGSGAFSYVDGVVYASTFSLNSYVDRVGRGLTGVTGERRLGLREQMRYDFLVRLFGLELKRDWVRRRYGGRRFERWLAPELAAMRAVGALEADAEAWRLTDRGMYYWVLMMSAFFESVNAFREQMRHRIRAELEDEEDEDDEEGVVRVPLADLGGRASANTHRAPLGMTRAR